MRVLQIHKTFHLRGGADTFFFKTCDLLAGHGHEVAHFSTAHAKNLPSPYADYFVSGFTDEDAAGLSLGRKAKAFVQGIYSFEARKNLAQLVADFQPEVVHAHSINYQLSPAIFDVFRDSRIPLVITLHDYHIICGAGTLYTAGAVCERCRGGRHYNAVVHSCYWNRPASLMASLSHYLHDVRGSWDCASKLIVPSLFLRDKLIDFGIAADRIVHLPIFVDFPDHDFPGHDFPDHDFPEEDFPEHDFPKHHFPERDVPGRHAAEPDGARKDRPEQKLARRERDGGFGDDYVLYFGRLDANKGVELLLEAMQPLACGLLLIGDGPASARVEELCRTRPAPTRRISFVASRAELQQYIRDSLFSVVPSLWYENQPAVILESYAMGKPVIGSRLGGIPELIEAGSTGLLAEPGNIKDWREKIAFLVQQPDLCRAWGCNGRRKLRQGFGRESHYERLMKIYRSVLPAHPSGRSSLPAPTNVTTMEVK